MSVLLLLNFVYKYMGDWYISLIRIIRSYIKPHLTIIFTCLCCCLFLTASPSLPIVKRKKIYKRSIEKNQLKKINTFFVLLTVTLNIVKTLVPYKSWGTVSQVNLVNSVNSTLVFPSKTKLHDIFVTLKTFKRWSLLTISSSSLVLILFLWWFIFCLFVCFVFIGIHSAQSWTATAGHGVTTKKNKTKIKSKSI